MVARDWALLVSCLLVAGCAQGHRRALDAGPGVDAQQLDGCTDGDGDGLCGAADACEGHDDRLDADGDGTPDGCDCDARVCAENAECAETRTGAVCICAEGYEGSGDACTRVDCGPPDAPENGRVSFGMTTFGSTATYFCDAGFSLMGDMTRTCGADGAWSGSAPTCAPVECGPLPAPANGHVSVDGIVATYACNAGYVLVGDATRTCASDGTWTGAAPTCELVDCGALSPPANGSVTAAATTYGTTAVYACNAGYTLSGDATRTCQADGTWSGAPPACNPVDCGPLAPPANGTVSAPSTTYGATATYACNPGYALSGSATRTCQASGAWSGSAPTCVVSGCGPIGAPANGTVSVSGTGAGATATYACNPGYRLALAQHSVCDGTTWQGATPECRQVLSCGGCGGTYAAGDRVRALAANPSGASGVAAGARGTVIASQTSGAGLEVLIEWDGWTGGHDGNCSVATCGACTPRPERGRWWTDCSQIAPLRVTCACGGVFSEGDRVRAIVASPSGASVPLGRLGTVIAGSSTATLPVQIQWDSWTGGHTGNCAVATCGTCTTSSTTNRWWTACDQVGR